MSPCLPVLHPPVPTTVQLLGGADAGTKKDQRQWLSMAAAGRPAPWSLPALTLGMGAPCGQAGGVDRADCGQSDGVEWGMQTSEG